VKATGIVRRIDDLGRVVIPKEIRKTLHIREGDPLEIFVDRDGEVILKKYSPIGELGEFAQEYADSLYENSGHITIICDRDGVVAVAGVSKKAWVDKPVTGLIEQCMQERRSVVAVTGGKQNEDTGEEEWDLQVMAIAPIIAQSDPIGAVVLGSSDAATEMSDIELKLVETAASFLAKQMGH